MALEQLVKGACARERQSCANQGVSESSCLGPGAAREKLAGAHGHQYQGRQTGSRQLHVIAGSGKRQRRRRLQCCNDFHKDPPLF
jgi:hypothetical protein